MERSASRAPDLACWLTPIRHRKTSALIRLAISSGHHRRRCARHRVGYAVVKEQISQGLGLDSYLNHEGINRAAKSVCKLRSSFERHNA